MLMSSYSYQFVISDCSVSDTGYLLNFLRTGKFSQLRAREVLEGYLKMKSKYPEWLDDVDTADPEIQRFLGTG